MIRYPARRKGYSVIILPSDGSGFKTWAMIAVEHLGGKWIHRERGYQVPSRKVDRIEDTLRRLASFRSILSKSEVR